MVGNYLILRKLKGQLMFDKRIINVSWKLSCQSSSYSGENLESNHYVALIVSHLPNIRTKIVCMNNGQACIVTIRRQPNERHYASYPGLSLRYWIYHMLNTSDDADHDGPPRPEFTPSQCGLKYHMQSATAATPSPTFSNHL